MFKVTQTPTFWQDVKGELQGESGGRVPFKFRLQFKRLERDALEALNKRIRDAQASNEEGFDDLWFLDQITVGWDEVADADGKPLDFTPDNFRQLLGVVYTRVPTLAFYAGLPGARGKN